MTPSRFSSVRHIVREKILFEEFQDHYSCGRFGYWNGTILVKLSLHVAVMLPTKFPFNLTYYGSGGDVV